MNKLNPLKLLPPEVKSALELDIAAYGTAYLKIDDKGVGVRVDPEHVRLAYETIESSIEIRQRNDDELDYAAPC